MATFLSSGVHPEAVRAQRAALEHASGPLPAHESSSPHVLLEARLAKGAEEGRAPGAAGGESGDAPAAVSMTLELFEELASDEVARLRSRLLPGAPGSLVGAPMRLDASESALVFALPPRGGAAAPPRGGQAPPARVSARARACLRHSARGAASLSRDGRELAVALHPVPALDADRVVVGRVVPAAVDGGAALRGLDRAEAIARRARAQRRDLAWLEAGEPCGAERLRTGGSRAGKRDALAMDATGEQARAELRDAVAEGLQKKRQTEGKKRRILGLEDDDSDEDDSDEGGSDEDDGDDDDGEEDEDGEQKEGGERKKEDEDGDGGKDGGSDVDGGRGKK